MCFIENLRRNFSYQQLQLQPATVSLTVFTTVTTIATTTWKKYSYNIFFQMSNFATLFALGQDHNILYFVTSDQLQMMEPIFRNAQNFSKNVRLIEDFDPLWQLRIWTNPFP